MSLPLRFRRCRPSPGVTLLELLIYMGLAAGLTAAVSQVLVSSIRSDSRLELHLRAIDLWGHISFLIESDVAEGSEILQRNPFTACGGGISLFTILVPVELDVSTTPPTPLSVVTVPIHYYLRNGDLFRCGPPFHANGSLDLGNTPAKPNLQEALVGRRVSLVLVSSSTEEDSRSVHYHLNLLTPDGQEVFPTVRSAIARTRVSKLP